MGGGKLPGRDGDEYPAFLISFLAFRSFDLYASVAQRRVRFMLTRDYGTALIAVPRLANSPKELAHILYETLLVRDEFANLLSL